MVQRINPLASQQQLRIEEDSTETGVRNRYNRHWNASSIAPASEDYDLDFTVKVQDKGSKQVAQQSNSCTCNNTCEGCVQTDSGCHQTQGCASTSHRCGHTDSC